MLSKMKVLSLLVLGTISFCSLVNAVAPEWEDEKNEHGQYNNVTIRLKSHPSIKNYLAPQIGEDGREGDIESLNKESVNKRYYMR